MSSEQLDAFLEKLESDPALEEQFEIAENPEAVIAIAKSAGFAITVEDLKNAAIDSEEEPSELDAFLDKLESDPELEEQFEKAESIEEEVAIAKSAGFAITAEDLKNAEIDSEEELSAEQLAEVAGGRGFRGGGRGRRRRRVYRRSSYGRRRSYTPRNVRGRNSGSRRGRPNKFKRLLNYFR